MRVLIIYATNSGSTFTAARVLQSLLAPRHSVTLVEAKMATPAVVEPAEAIIIGSPSWDHDKKEGQPPESIIARLTQLAPTTVTNKKWVIFGCGDRSYTYFCGAVDVLEEWLAKYGIQPLIPSLRLDGFLFHLPEGINQITEWGREVAQRLTQK
ncbi:MAG: flavodoxin domain-containing protein [Candidatus Magasanikbacteria bacterium]|nr:flavodoxin domain-containing protein [Candidatus Magasanikbacteria bacterium]